MECENKYTLDDIRQFINDYKENCDYSQNWIFFMSIISRKIYERIILENMKISAFEKAYEKAKNGSFDDQAVFIGQMTPVLDEFYVKHSKRKRNIRKNKKLDLL